VLLDERADGAFVDPALPSDSKRGKLAGLNESMNSAG
jgi:hypothetical protein